MIQTKDSRISKDFVLDNVSENDRLESQIQIFQKYLGITNVRQLLEEKAMFCNPLRKDQFPTCSFKLFTGRDGYKLWFRDWGDVRGYDCFDLVQHMANCNFTEALELICHHFNLLSAERALELKYVMTPTNILQLAQKEAKDIEIRIKTTPWTKEHLEWWKRFHLDLDDLEDDVVAIKCYWINGTKYIPPKNFGFAYMFGGYDYKLYFPKADKTKKELRFIHNRADILQGQAKVDFSKSIIFITSSYKDVKVLKKIAKLYDFDFTAIAPMSETTPIEQKIIDFLKTKFTYVILFHNNDKAGIQAAISQSESYGCLYVHNPIGEAKDPSDMVEEKGLKYTADTIKTLLYHVIPPF